MSVPEKDCVERLELTVAIASSEERQRHERKEESGGLREDLRRDIKLYVALGVTAGNAVAAFIAAKVGPAPAAQGVAHALRSILPL